MMQVMVMGLLHLKNVVDLMGMKTLCVQMKQFFSYKRLDASASSEVTPSPARGGRQGWGKSQKDHLHQVGTTHSHPYKLLLSARAKSTPSPPSPEPQGKEQIGKKYEQLRE
jgi:hypothetical protein